MSVSELASVIDHTVLAPAATDKDMAAGCAVARQFNTATMFIKPYFIIEAHRLLAGSGVKIGCPVGFPHGLSLPQVKADEAEAAMDMGAEEIDMVVNIGKVVSEEWKFVATDISAVEEVVHERQLILKVIFETCYLNDSQKIELCRICEDIGVDFAKTSTGFGPAGATPADIVLMARNLSTVKIKAAGGIRTLGDINQMLGLGVHRIGTSATVEILTEAVRLSGTRI